MKILAFAASNSSESINNKLVSYAAKVFKEKFLKDAQIEILDLNDYELPIYSQDREAADGVPNLAHQFFSKIGDADALLVSFAEHNGSYTAAYKNIFDWSSRIDPMVFQNKPMVMLSTSPGAGGASSVLESAINSAPFFKAVVKSSLSIPNFFDNFDTKIGELSNEELSKKLEEALSELN